MMDDLVSTMRRIWNLALNHRTAPPEAMRDALRAIEQDAEAALGRLP